LSPWAMLYLYFRSGTPANCGRYLPRIKAERAVNARASPRKGLGKLGSPPASDCNTAGFVSPLPWLYRLERLVLLETQSAQNLSGRPEESWLASEVHRMPLSRIVPSANSERRKGRSCMTSSVGTAHGEIVSGVFLPALPTLAREYCARGSRKGMIETRAFPKWGFRSVAQPAKRELDPGLRLATRVFCVSPNLALLP
jgi:hypothetical protein